MLKVAVCVSGRDLAIRDESNRGTLRPSPIRKSVETKDDITTGGNQQGVQTSLGAGIYIYIQRESETVAPPGCGTKEPQTRDGHISQKAFVPSVVQQSFIL